VWANGAGRIKKRNIRWPEGVKINRDWEYKGKPEQHSWPHTDGPSAGNRGERKRTVVMRTSTEE